MTKEAVYTYGSDKSRVDWMLDYQVMVVLAANRGCLPESAQWWQVGDEELREAIDDLVVKIVTPLHKNDRAKFNTVFWMEITAAILLWKPDDDAVIRQCTGEFGYGYEYGSSIMEAVFIERVCWFIVLVYWWNINRGEPTPVQRTCQTLMRFAIEIRFGERLMQSWFDYRFSIVPEYVHNPDWRLIEAV